ncbi:MAG: hypothetical protein ABI564_17635 [Ideonella sp.]
MAMQEQLRQPVIIENTPSGNGTIGVEASLLGQAQSYTLLLSAGKPKNRTQCGDLPRWSELMRTAIDKQ